MINADGRVDEPNSLAAMNSLSQDEKQLLVAQRNEAASRRTLIEALVIMGRFQEALIVEDTEEGKAWIEKLIQAEAQDDSHRCECKAHIDQADYVRNPDAEPVLERTPHYIRTYRHYSHKYKAMVWFYQCSQCGSLQSLPDDQSIDELHEQIYGQRAKALAPLVGNK